MDLLKFTGTIITGSPRSGTTLALRVYCPSLRVEEEKAGSIFNEPQPLTRTIVNQSDLNKALALLPLALKNVYCLIKTPHIAFIAPYIEPKYKFIVTFRDLRFIIPSMLKHPITPKLELSNKPYWLNYVQVKVPDDLIERAILVAEESYKCIFRYKGQVEVWNYGFWNEWIVRNKEIKHLYGRKGETSKPVLDDIYEGRVFSDKNFSFAAWNEFCSDFNISKIYQEKICEANERIKKLYKKRGIELKTLEDYRGGTQEI
jgi:hypothetical protein